MTCQQHRTYTSRTCPSCQRSRTVSGTTSYGSPDIAAQNLLTQSIVTNAVATAANDQGSNYCAATSTDPVPGCAPSC